MSHHICPVFCYVLITCPTRHCCKYLVLPHILIPCFNLPAEVTLRRSACWCTNITTWSNTPSKQEAVVASILLWYAAFPLCGQSWTDMRGRRRGRIAELGKNMVFCWCLQDPRQMVSHRWMLCAGRSATTAIALVSGSFPQLTVWPGQLSLSIFYSPFPDWAALDGS